MQFFEGLVLLLHRMDCFFQLADGQVEVIPIIIAIGNVPLAVFQFEDYAQGRFRLIISGFKFFVGRLVDGEAGDIDAAFFFGGTAFSQGFSIE